MSELDIKKSEEERDYDFEREMRVVIEGVKRERRWRSRSKGNILDRIRRGLAVWLLAFANCISAIARWVDSWRAGPENVLEHSFKQALQVFKMLRIENAHGNPHGLDFHRLLEWALLHDLAEGDPNFRDIHFHEKRKSDEIKTRYKNIEKAILLRIFRRLMPDSYRNCIPEPLDMDMTATSEDKLFWDAAEHISHCYFMLEEVRRGRINKKRRARFMHDVLNVHVNWLVKNAYRFRSVREIINKELSPKLRKLKNNA